jgi:hypothetical protein
MPRKTPKDWEHEVKLARIEEKACLMFWTVSAL